MRPTDIIIPRPDPDQDIDATAPHPTYIIPTVKLTYKWIQYRWHGRWDLVPWGTVNESKVVESNRYVPFVRPRRWVVTIICRCKKQIKKRVIFFLFFQVRMHRLSGRIMKKKKKKNPVPAGSTNKKVRPDYYFIDICPELPLKKIFGSYFNLRWFMGIVFQ